MSQITGNFRKKSLNFIDFALNDMAKFHHQVREEESSMPVKVLIVEDEIIVAEDVRSKLQANGYEVTGIVDTFDRALGSVKANRPDIMILDIRIKGEITGVETAIILAGQFEKPIPVVFLTAFSESDYPVLKALEDYVFIQKPFTEEALFGAIEKALASPKNSFI
jgi:CheY-like chemotaxis protein